MMVWEKSRYLTSLGKIEMRNVRVATSEKVIEFSVAVIGV